MAGREKKVVELEEGWEFMRRGIQKVIHLLERTSDDQFKVEEYIHLYTKIYDMCTQKPPYDYSDALYERYKQSFADYISAKVLPVLREKHGEYLLKEIVHRFANHKVMVRWLSRFFNYLDRYFISRRSLPSLSNAGLVCFKELVYEQLKDSVKDAVIVLINKEREGEQIDRALVKNVLDIFVEVDMGEMICYEEDFEKDMLEDTSAYYQRKASTWIHEDSCPLYMIKAEECLKKEKDRAEQYLHASSELKLLKKAEEQLLSKKESDLIEKEHSGCHVLLRDDKTEDLMRMYRLFLRVQGLEPIAFMFRSHVTSEGNALVGQAEEAASNRKMDKLAGSGAATYETIFVRRVIELHDKYMDYVSNCFGSHTLFHKALKEAFEVFCNKNIAGSSTAELLALYCDDLLKKGGSQKLSDEAIEEILDKVVKILAYVSDKDLFGEFYRKKLARRLLFDRSANDDHERSILTKLKQQYGGQFTSKMEGMVTDLTLAKENQKHYTEFLADKRGPGIEFSATVLTTGFWPTYKTSELALPEEMVKCVESFKNFYNARTASRKLTWIYSLGNCNVVAKFDAKPIELIVTTYQAAALVLFNGADRLSYTDIMTQLNLTDDDVIRLLHSLSCAKYKILLKRPYTESIIKETDIFEFNRKFTDKMRRIKIPLPPTDEKKKIIEDVDKDRRYAIDASLVRIMKSRKALTHQQLVLECVDQLSKMFKPDFKVIKKRIEELIQREYLERDKDNPNMYRYLA